jgi:hypothetical protein
MTKYRPVKRQRTQAAPQKIISVPTRNEIDVDPNQTLGPETNVNVNIANFLRSDATTASIPDDTGQEEEEEPFVKNPYELFDKFASGKIQPSIRITLTLTSLVWFAATLWLLIQDNAVGRLETPGWPEQFFRTKVLTTTLLLLVPLIIILLGELFSQLRSIIERSRKPKRSLVPKFRGFV